MSAAHTNYSVSPSGAVASMTGWRGHIVRTLAAHPNKHGYLRVRMVIDGKRVSRFVHKLVAEAYLPPRPSPLHEICHINGDRIDNRAENLRWGTRADNAADRERHGRTSRGAAHSEAIKRGIHGHV